MKNHKIEGSIINIGSVNGSSKPTDNCAAYCSSKAAIHQITKALVGELSKEKIRINCIIPGIFNTEESEEDRTKRDTLKSIVPMSFVAQPIELEATILYLASNNASRYITGSCITVDGGFSWR